jgi:hypothetical protein
MNIDDIFDQTEKRPLRTFALLWIVGGIVSLIGLTIAILIIVAILSGFGVI